MTTSDFGLSDNNGPWRALTSDTFVWQRALVGTHLIIAAIGAVHESKYEQQFTVDCQPKEAVYVQLVTKGGFWSSARIEFNLRTAETAMSHLRDRRIVME